MYKLMHSVRAYKMIFAEIAVLERRLIQLLIKWLQFFINNICCFINHFTNNNLVIIFLFVILNFVTICQMAAELLRFSVCQNRGRRHLGFGWILFSDYPRSLPDDLKLCLKFYVDPIYTCDFNFRKFALKCLFRPQTWEFGGFRP